MKTNYRNNMSIFSKLAFWKKKELPNLPEETSLPPLDPNPNFQQPPPQESNLPPQEDYRRNYPQPNFDDFRNPEPSTNSEFQVISSKLDVLNAKIEVLNERLTNIEKNLETAKVKW